MPILMFSMQDVPEVIQASKLVHAQRFVTKSEDASASLNAVDALLSGENFFPDKDKLVSVKPNSRDSISESLPINSRLAIRHYNS